MLEQRIREGASGPLARYAAAHEDWYGVLARRAPWLVAAAAAAMLMLWISLPPSNADGFRLMEVSLAPDEFAGSLMGGPEPPSVDAILVQFPPEE